MLRRRKPVIFLFDKFVGDTTCKSRRTVGKVLKQGRTAGCESHWQNEVKNLAFIAMELLFVAIHKPANLKNSRIQNGFPEMCLVDFLGII